MSRNLLWMDSRAGLLVGALTLALGYWLAPWYGLSLSLLLLIAAANLAYGAFSGWLLARPRPRPLWLIHALVVANLAWAAVCLLLAGLHLAEARWLGLAHLVSEAVFVGGLAVMEWRQRFALQTVA